MICSIVIAAMLIPPSPHGTAASRAVGFDARLKGALNKKAPTFKRPGLGCLSPALRYLALAGHAKHLAELVPGVLGDSRSHFTPAGAALESCSLDRRGGLGRSLRRLVGRLGLRLHRFLLPLPGLVPLSGCLAGHAVGPAELLVRLPRNCGRDLRAATDAGQLAQLTPVKLRGDPSPIPKQREQLRLPGVEPVDGLVGLLELHLQQADLFLKLSLGNACHSRFLLHPSGCGMPAPGLVILKHTSKACSLKKPRPTQGRGVHQFLTASHTLTQLGPR